MSDKTEKQEIMYHHTAGQAKRFITHFEKARTCFREAAKLCDPVIEISGNAFGISDLFPISCLIGLKIPPSKLGPWVRFPSTDSTGRRTGCAPPAGCYDPEGDSHRPLKPF